MGREDMAGTGIGTVVQVGGSKASLRLGAAALASQTVTVGRFIGVDTPNSTVIGVVTQVAFAPGSDGREAACVFDIMGELSARRGGERRYSRGVMDYPALGAPGRLLTRPELLQVFACPGHRSIAIGHIHQDPTVEARLKVDDLLAKHFAILGSTGVGKSSGVAVLIGEILRARPDLRVFFVDAHNEYGTTFADVAEILNPGNLKLPFWLFNFEEFVDVLFRGRPGLDEETAILAELIPAAKSMWNPGRPAADLSALRRAEAKSKPYGPDTPVPYRLLDLIGLVEERRGKLDQRAAIGHYNRLLSRIETVRTDPRYGFMFDAANVGGDTMADVIMQLFRLADDGRPMTVMQLAGFPAEVVDSVVSVVCRMAFELGLWSDGVAPMLVVCEEAHRYVPSDKSLGFGPTRKAISRIAKEGRKYGVHLGLVTQRPAELDQTIVSQCNTVFAMRMANERDQAIVRAAVSDAAATLLDFVPALGVQEVFAFGEGVSLPTRLRFLDLPAHRIPRSEAVQDAALRPDKLDRETLQTVVERWRGAIGGRARSDDALAAAPAAPVGRGSFLPQAGDASPASSPRPGAGPVLDYEPARAFGYRNR